MPKGEHLRALNAQRAAAMWPKVEAALGQVVASGRDAAPAAEVAVIADLTPMQVGFAVRYAGNGWKLDKRDGRAWVVRDIVRPMGARAVAAADDEPAPAPAPAAAGDTKAAGLLDWLFGP